MARVVEELIVALKYKVDSTELTKARAEARKAAKEIAGEFDEALDSVDESLEDTAKAADKSAKSTSQVWIGALREIGAGLTRLGGKAFSEAFDFIRDTFEDTRELDTFAQAMGTTGEELSEVVTGLGRLRIESDNSREAVKTLRENLGELSRIGTGPALDALGSLGLKLEDINNLPIKEQLNILADAMVNVKDPAKQLSIAIELMGEDGRALLPALLGGAEGMDAVTTAAREAGEVITQETIEATRELDASLKGVKGRLKGVSLEILQAAVPALSEGAEGVTAWVEENDELIDQNLPELIDQLSSGMGVLAEAVLGVAGALSTVRDAFQSIRKENLGGGLLRPGTGIDTNGNVFNTQAPKDTSGADPSLFEPTDEFRPDNVRARNEANEANAVLPALLASNQKVIDAAAQRAAAKKFEDDNKPKPPKGGGGKSKRRGPSDEALEKVEFTELGDEFRRLGERFGAEDLAIEAAITAAASQFEKGASRGVAGKAGRGALGKLIDVDLNKRPNRDPLSELLGVDSLPDVTPADLAQDRAPQILTATINNNFNIQQSFAVNGADRPDLIPGQITDAFREMMGDELAAVSKYAKINWAR